VKRDYLVVSTFICIADTPLFYLLGEKNNQIQSQKQIGHCVPMGLACHTLGHVKVGDKEQKKGEWWGRLQLSYISSHSPDYQL